tara:strand:- start:198 stop:413 length:216 start_codon:yes stop_codon:yes gene_type:complete
MGENLLDVLEKELRVLLAESKTRAQCVQEVVPEDLDQLLLLVKNNPESYAYVLRDIRERTCRLLEEKIGGV